MTNSQTITLNGRRYDALSGKEIKDEDNDQASSKHSVSAHHKNIKVIDGFIRARTSSKPTIKHAKTDLTKAKAQVTHKVAPHINRVTEHSKTLMRNAVRNPSVTKIKKQQYIAKQHINHAISRGVEATIPAKNSLVERANEIKRSEFIGKFSELTHPVNPITADPKVIQTSANSEVHLKKLDHLAQIEANPAGMDDLFTEAALKLSDAHEPARRRDPRFYESIANKLRISVRTLTIATICLAILIIVGVTAYIFKDNINLYVADNRTGINGILPAYRPSGFSLSSIKYTSGASASGYIELFYKSNSDSRYYDITERSTNWDNQALINSVLTPTIGNNYTTNISNGRTVFSYGPNSAWISSNLYYNLLNRASLTTNQINQIVSST